MVLRHIAKVGAALLVAGALAVGAAPTASAHSTTSGNRSLASVLAKDGSGFDRNSNDFDIVDNAVQAVLKAKPNSPVKVLADGKTPVTAFLPTDRAFRLLVKDLTGTSYRSEKKVFETVAGLGIDTVETVLLYHVVPGATITYKQALRSNGAALTMASGGTVKVKVRKCVFVQLVDADTDDANPYVVKADINKGNKQIAHGIDRVLRPINL
jgi:uncharacterized surface protein with fasciclin (FAS1) repeats